MAGIKGIRKIYKSTPTLEGAGVHLKRAFGFPHAPELDPFLLLDEFHSGNPSEYLPGFPWHPHRGIETITYMLEGVVEHGDSMGNRGEIRPGDVQWMTAGSGIIHQEMPRGDGEGRMWGFQLWANLPAKNKMMDPRYREVKSGEIPAVPLKGGGTARIICGEMEGVAGPVRDIVIDPLYSDVSIPPEGSISLDVGRDRIVMVYVFDGAGCFGEDCDDFSYDVASSRYFDIKRDRRIGPDSLVLLGPGDTLAADAGEKGMRFLLIAGKPLKEPVAWYGPIVMNTREELRLAFEEFRNGTFVKKR